jgi:hypothetical protein
LSTAPDTLVEHLNRYARDTTETLIVNRVQGAVSALTIAADRVRTDALFGAECPDVVAFLEELAAELAESIHEQQRGDRS